MKLLQFLNGYSRRSPQSKRGFSGETDSKESSAMQKTLVGSLGQEDPWRRKWQYTLVFLPREFHVQRSLAGYSPWGCKRVRHDLALAAVTTSYVFGSGD